MAIGSTVVVWSGGGGARAAGLRYAVVHLLGGVLLMAGIAGHIADTGSTAFTAMHTDSVGALADRRRLPGQRRRPAAVGMAARFLPGVFVQRHRVPLRLHHQDRRLCSAARLPRRRGSDLRRPVDGLLRHHLRHPGKRHPPHPVLFAGQPGRLHGDGHRHRHADGAERRRRPRLHPHHLQGAAAHVGRLGDDHGRDAPRARSSAGSTAPCR